MNPDSLNLNLPTDPPLPPPPAADRDTVQRWQAERLADFYQSSHYDAWFARTSEELRHAKAFVWID